MYVYQPVVCYVCMNVCVFISAFAESEHACALHVCMPIYLSLYVYTCIYARARAHTHTHTYIHTHTHTHTHTICMNWHTTDTRLDNESFLLKPYTND